MPRWDYWINLSSVAFLALFLFGIALAVIGWENNIWTGCAVVSLAVMGVCALFLGLWDTARKQQDIKNMAATLAAIKAAIPVHSPSTAVENISKVTNRHLRALVADLAARMRTFQSGLDASTASNTAQRMPPEQYLIQYTKANAEFRERFLPDALALREEMQKRLGIMTPNIGPEDVALNYGMLAGVSPVSGAANNLEALARRLAQ